MWGSNWPVCFQKAPLTAWREVTESLLADLQPGERDSILGATAARIYRLG
jgi:L-fuconolactonase